MIRVHHCECQPGHLEKHLNETILALREPNVLRTGNKHPHRVALISVFVRNGETYAVFDVREAVEKVDYE